LYLTLALLNIFRLPAINGPDEGEHLQYMLVLRNQHAMPLLPRYVPAGQEARMGEQAQHPPLYYAALAAVSYAFADPTADGAIRLLKLVSVLMGLGALLCTAACARRLWPHDSVTALAAAAALAFLPMFWVMTSLLNNTAGSLLASGLGLLLLLRALQAPQVRVREWLWVGLAVSLGMLAKVTAVWLLPAIAVVIWARWRREEQRTWRTALTMLWPVALPLAIFVGGWLSYNLSHFGVLMPERVLGRRYLPAGVMTIFFLPFARNLLLRTIFDSIPLSMVSPFWLLRGPVTDFAALLMLGTYALPPLLAVLVSGWRRRTTVLRRPEVGEAMLLSCFLGGLAAWVVAVEAVLHDWNTGLYAGRYAVEAAPACALIWAAGWKKLLPRPQYRVIAVGVWLLALLVISLLIQQFMTSFFQQIR
ncbi:MAG: glycosyltransferase family 39 protein, partial [Bacteroidota bacterium]